MALCQKVRESGDSGKMFGSSRNRSQAENTRAKRSWHAINRKNKNPTVNSH